MGSNCELRNMSIKIPTAVFIYAIQLGREYYLISRIVVKNLLFKIISEFLKQINID